MDMKILVAQSIGAMGMIAGFLWPALRTRWHLLFAQAACFLLFAWHFALIGANTAAFLNAVGGLQAAAAIPLERWRPFRFVYIATLPPLALGVYWTWAGLISVLAGVGLIFTTISRYQIDLLRLRLFGCAGLIFWFGHNLLVMSIAGMTTDLVGLSINLWMIRHDREEMTT